MSHGAAVSQLADPACWCGRPLKHVGSHAGPRAAVREQLATKGAAKPHASFPATVEAQLSRCGAALIRLKAEIATRQDALVRVEAERAALVALHGVYRNLALPAPSQAAPVSPAATVTEAHQRAALAPPARPGEPIEADIPTIHAWAVHRGLVCHSADDLRAVNAKRERLGLAPYKLQLGRKRAAV